MDKYNNIDVDKLEFKREYKEAGLIMIRIAKLNRLHPVGKEVLVNAIKHGHHLDKIPNLFTPESIKKATQKKQKSSKKDESEN